MKRKVKGSDMLEFLGGLAPGETVFVNGQEICSLDNWKFEVTDDDGARVVGREEAEAMFDAEATYEVLR